MGSHPNPDLNPLSSHPGSRGHQWRMSVQRQRTEVPPSVPKLPLSPCLAWGDPLEAAGAGSRSPHTEGRPSGAQSWHRGRSGAQRRGRGEEPRPATRKGEDGTGAGRCRGALRQWGAGLGGLHEASASSRAPTGGECHIPSQ